MLYLRPLILSSELLIREALWFSPKPSTAISLDPEQSMSLRGRMLRSGLSVAMLSGLLAGPVARFFSRRAAPASPENSLGVRRAMEGLGPRGTPAGEFRANTYTTNSQNYPAVALDASGNFVITWHSYGSYGSDSSGISI